MGPIHPICGKQTIKIRFGEWNHALAAAGLSHLIKYRGGLRLRLRDEELESGMVQFYSTNPPSDTAQTYDSYSAQRGIASLATMWVRLGKWSEIHAMVRKLLRFCAQPDGSWELGNRVAALSPKWEARPLITKAEAVATQMSGKITAAGYEAASSESDAPAAVIESRCGSWTEALREAKL